MNRPDQNGPGIEATLDDLYANEFNVELSWNRKRGFRAVLGNPPLAKKAFRASGDAVRWLKEQALEQFPRAKFRAKGPADARREAILDGLCASDIPGSISWVWEGGFHATIGEPKLGEKWPASNAGEVLDWLRNQAALHHPAAESTGGEAGFGPMQT